LGGLAKLGELGGGKAQTVIEGFNVHGALWGGGGQGRYF